MIFSHIFVKAAKLSEIVTAREGRLTKELLYGYSQPKEFFRTNLLLFYSSREHPNSKRGFLIIHAEEVRELKYSVTLQLAGKHLDKKDLFGKSDPFVVISRSAEGGQ